MVKLHFGAGLQRKHTSTSQFNSQMLGFKPPDKLSEDVCLGQSESAKSWGKAVVTLGATSRAHLKLRLFSERLDKQSLKLRWFRVPHGNTANKDKLKYGFLQLEFTNCNRVQHLSLVSTSAAKSLWLTSAGSSLQFSRSPNLLLVANLLVSCPHLPWGPWEHYLAIWGVS